MIFEAIKNLVFFSILLYFPLFSIPPGYRVSAGSFPYEETTSQIMAREESLKKADSIDEPLVIKKYNVPTLTIDESYLLPQDPSFYESEDFRSPQTPTSINFTSVTFADTFSFPPDSDGVAGPTQYLTVVNGRIRLHSKLTGAIDPTLNTTLDNFFLSVRNGSRTTDPRVKYDRAANAWYVICINVTPTHTENRVLIAVSNSRIISGSTIWRYFFFDQSAVNPVGDVGLFFDFPTLGYDTHALYIGGNQFNGSGGYVNSTAFVVQKSSLLSGGPLVVTAFRNLINGGGPVTPQGVENVDPNPLQGFFVGNVNNNFLALRIVLNPWSTNPTMSGAIFIPITPIAAPLDVPSLGSPTPLDSISDRLAEVHIRNNQMWMAHNIGLNNTGSSTSGLIDRTGIRWYQYNMAVPATPILVQSGTLFDSAASNPRFYWVPSVMSSGQGHMALGFSTAGATQFANAGTVGRLSTNALGTLGTPILYTNSTTAYNPAGGIQGGAQRWGDYSVTSLDPQDNMTFWTIQEWCNATNSYGCQVVQLLAPPPANITSATPSAVLRGLPAVVVTINGASINGSGFYDPGAGFEKRLTVLITGGVIVNQIIAVTPTSVILSINTSFASVGLQSVRIRNPDGQQKIGAVLTIL